jgi:hypothetical protein
MPINASVEFKRLQGAYALARTKEEKLKILEDLLREAPKHKGAENLLAQLRRRKAKLKKEIEKGKERKKGRSSEGIKKEGDLQIMIIGLTNSGKSSLLSNLTKTKVRIAEYPFTTLKPEQRMWQYGGGNLQCVELPALTGIMEKDKFQLGFLKMTDFIIILVKNLDQLRIIETELKNSEFEHEDILIILNREAYKYPEKIKMDFLGEKRKFIRCSVKDVKAIKELSKEIFSFLGLIRIYTKDPSKEVAKEPVVFQYSPTVEEVASKIRKEYVKNFQKAKVKGPSAKFPWQDVGLNHLLEDGDILEIYLKK